MRYHLVGVLSSLLCTVLLLAVCSINALGSSDAYIGHPTSRCHLESWEYVPSQLERTWMSNAKQWQKQPQFCNMTKAYQSNITFWLQSNAELMLTTRTRLKQPGGNGVFSAFVRTFSCNDSIATHTSWIEPLAFGLRQPTAPCAKDDVLKRDYLLVASRADSLWHPQQHCSPPRAFLFDMGASTWSEGGGGASQSFLVDVYKKRGIVFDRILAWEASHVDVAALQNEVPREYHAVYQYFNIPVTPDRKDLGNPLNILKAITSQTDFVAVKLDIDNGPIENQLIAHILEDPDVYQRIDEFFFEHHVNFEAMLPWWGSSVDQSKDLADSYALFSELRRRGIRAHSWP